jgi:hypothetical protein
MMMFHMYCRQINLNKFVMFLLLPFYCQAYQRVLAKISQSTNNPSVKPNLAEKVFSYVQQI